MSRKELKQFRKFFDPRVGEHFSLEDPPELLRISSGPMPFSRDEVGEYSCLESEGMGLDDGYIDGYREDTRPVVGDGELGWPLPVVVGDVAEPAVVPGVVLMNSRLLIESRDGEIERDCCGDVFWTLGALKAGETDDVGE